MTANADGRPLYTAFQFLPSKRRYPEYFSVIDNPIDLKTIAQKIQGGEYTNLNELEKDLQMMVRNACHFNEPGSQIYKDAKTLKKVSLNYQCQKVYLKLFFITNIHHLSIIIFRNRVPHIIVFQCFFCVFHVHIFYEEHYWRVPCLEA